MSKSTKSPTIETVNFSDSWSDGAFVEWITTYKQYLIWGILALFAAMAITYRVLTWSNLSTEEDYYRAQTIYNKFQDDAFDNQEELQELKTIMQRHPELQSKYDGPIAQTLIIEGEIPQAKDFANMVFQRTRPDQLALFEEYSKTSLLIGEGSSADALQQAILLKAKIENDNLTDSALYAFNAIRIAFLNKELGNKDAEKEAWAAVQTLGENSKAAAEVIGLFSSGSTSLNQFAAQKNSEF